MAISILTGREAPQRIKREPPKPEPTEVDLARAEFRDIAEGLRQSWEKQMQELREAMHEAERRSAAHHEEAMQSMREMNAAYATEIERGHQAMLDEVRARSEAERRLSESAARLQAAEENLSLERARPTPPQVVVQPEPAPAVPSDFLIENVQRKDGLIVGAYIRRVPKEI